MATSGSWNISWASSYWNSTSNTKYFHWYGNWSKSGNTITLSNMGLYMTFTHSSSGTGITDVVQPTGGGRQTVTWTFSGTQSNTCGINNSSFSVGSTATSATIQLLIDGETTGSTTISFDASVTAPTGLSASNVKSGPESFSATISVSGWGGAGNASTRYRELQVWTYNASSLVEPRRYEPVWSNDLSSTIEVNNSTTHGTLTIVPNTRYTLGMYASNGTANTESKRIGSYVTQPPHSTLKLDSVGETVAKFTLSVPEQGGYYDMTVGYQLDSGDPVNVTTATGSGTKGIAFTVFDMNPGTTHEVTAFLKSTSGEVVSNTVTFTTESRPGKLYGSAGETTYKVVSIANNTDFDADVFMAKWVSTYGKMTKKPAGFSFSSGLVNEGYVTIAPSTRYRIFSVPISDSELMKKFAEWGFNSVPVSGAMGYTTVVKRVTKEIKTLYGSVDGQTKAIDKLYGSVNGKTKLIFQASQYHSGGGAGA